MDNNTSANNLKIYELDLSVADTFYVFMAGKPVPVNKEHISERLSISYDGSGTLCFKQYADTPEGFFDLEELFYKCNGSLLKAVPAKEVTFASEFRLFRPGHDTISRSLSRRKDGSFSFAFPYCSVNQFGVAETTDNLWSGRFTLLRSDSQTHSVWANYSSDLNVFEDEREAAFYSDAFDTGSFASCLSIGAKAEGEIRNAIRHLKEVLANNGVRMVLDEADDNTIKFISKANVPGWNETDESGAEADEWFRIPKCMYMNFGFGSVNVKYVGYDEFLVKENNKENNQ